jgi:hypothetical protein
LFRELIVTYTREAPAATDGVARMDIPVVQAVNCDVNKTAVERQKENRYEHILRITKHRSTKILLNCNPEDIEISDDKQLSGETFCPEARDRPMAYTPEEGDKEVKDGRTDA